MSKVYKAAANGGSSRLMIHRNRDCFRLNGAGNVLEKDEEIFPDWVERCPNCWGDS